MDETIVQKHIALGLSDPAESGSVMVGNFDH